MMLEIVDNADDWFKPQSTSDAPPGQAENKTPAVQGTARDGPELSPESEVPTPVSMPPEMMRMSIWGGAGARPALYASYPTFTRPSSCWNIAWLSVTRRWSTATRRCRSCSCICGG